MYYKLCQFFKTHPVVFPKIVSSYPLDGAQVVFTDGSSNGRAAVIFGNEVKVIKIPNCSAQLAESNYLKFHCDVQIVTPCPQCAQFISSPNLGVNPRALGANDVWQMDVTHVSLFGKLQFVHVSIDTFSGMISASAHSG